MLELDNYNYTSKEYSLFFKLSQQIGLLEDREKTFIKGICKRVSKSKSVLYVLKDDNRIIRLIAISVTSFEEQPSLQIDYRFVSEVYRSKNLSILDNLKPFRYLIELVISIFTKIRNEVGLRYIILLPDNDELKDKYVKVGFSLLDKEWMYLKL